MSDPKLSDITGNPWDDLTAKEQRDLITMDSRKTYKAWRDEAMKPASEFSQVAMGVARFCANKVREFDGYMSLREDALREMNS